MKPQKIQHAQVEPLPRPLTPPPPYDISDILDDYFQDQDEDGRGGKGDSDDKLIEKAATLELESRPPLPPRPNTLPLIPSVAESSSVTSTETTIPEEPGSSTSFWKNALDETIYFAGGLISHPFEATKHFSVLRHSSGLVFYKGPSTSVTVTIFSDAPLPSDRSLWLQRKGFSGNMGMNMSTLLGTSSGWIDVTPTYEAIPSDVSEADERAWQRDISKHAKKTAKDKNWSKQTVRETCIIRIPASASDGYLRLVLCAGESRKKVLCPSPVFRIASTSSDVSIFRGASLSTMPLEAGLKAASVVGTTMANRYIGPARLLVDSRVQKVADKCKPGLVVKHAERIAYAKSGLQSKFDALEQNFDGARDVSYDPLHAPMLSDAPPEVVGADTGPEKPFPVKLSGIVVQGAGQRSNQLGIPTANLSGVPSDLLLRLNGIYMGWARVEPKQGTEHISREWHEAIITVGQSQYASPRIVGKNVATVHIIHNYQGETFFGAKLKTMLMAYLRPAPRADRSQQPIDIGKAVARDIDVTLASLSREAWGADRTYERLAAEKSSRTMVDKYVQVRTQIEKQIHSVPMHLAGVRTTGMEMIDQANGRGGMFIRR
ncbi:hypothetical protein BKA67DRAFT_565873 [Truncatella angustata]|uniref:Riboflavin kinase n=1 Tax=Truncatella angustata TaxID=152316 RepID=A0A9P8ZY50_9PEZI|nr:uncharacterized protein BKA67DRAFT_565873 [Truncatella angustata]KAH6654649.1 hypothetical protein BKA67DRAFT_565873 [Truncatella angustata]KAH8199656.1 hypothetical protein TruAng_006186 [Truncatella angustata]